MYRSKTPLTRRLAASAITCLALTLSGGAAVAFADPAPQPGGVGATLSWHACGSHGAQCTSLRVPLAWDEPQGAQISVGMTRLEPAHSAHNLGVLFFNPGGPGGDTRSILRDMAADFFPKALLRRFEIVGVDPRGVGGSRPLVTCGLPTRAATITVAPTTRAAYERLVAYNRRVGKSCLARTGPLLGNVDTLSTARDLDAARAALGAAQVSWLGLSYGSLLGQTYAHLFPTRVRAAVLDGALDHAVGSTRLAVDEARSVEGEFDQFASWCDGTASCALHGRDVKATYRALIARARRHPVPARGLAGGVTADQIGYATYGLMEISRRWPLLATSLKQAVARHPDAAALARVGVPEGAAYRATTCDDFPTDVTSYARMERLLLKLRRAAPVFGPYVEGLDVDTGCIGWPVASRNPWGPVPVSATPRLLVVSGPHDPSTPDAWGRGMARQISGSLLLRWQGSGHTGYFNDASVQAREVAYLLAPSAPVEGTVRTSG